MNGTWKTTSGGGGGGSGIGMAVAAIGAVVAVVYLAPLILSAAVAIAQAVAFTVVFITAAVVAVWRMRSRRPPRVLPIRHPLPQAQARVLPAQPARPAAIENHFHFHGMTADDVAEAIARRQEQS